MCVCLGRCLIVTYWTFFFYFKDIKMKSQVFFIINIYLFTIGNNNTSGVILWHIWMHTRFYKSTLRFIMSICILYVLFEAFFIAAFTSKLLFFSLFVKLCYTHALKYTIPGVFITFRGCIKEILHLYVGNYTVQIQLIQLPASQK